jgi:hypothetical protein
LCKCIGNQLSFSERKAISSKFRSMRYTFFIVISTILFCSCSSHETHCIEKVQLDSLYVSYYPSSNNYDVDSIQILTVDSSFGKHKEKIIVEYKDTLRFKSQFLFLKSPNLFVNSNFNGANKPFIWDDPFVNSFDVSLDSVRRYLKTFIIQNNTFSSLSEKCGKKKIHLSDTSKIVLIELYGGL